MIPVRRNEMYKGAQSIKGILRDQEEKRAANKPHLVQVTIDGKMVVDLSDEPEEIWEVKRQVYPNSQSIRVWYCDQHGRPFEEVIYRVAKPDYHKHHFQNHSHSNGHLSGFEVDERINKAVENAKQQWDHSQLQKEYNSTKKELEEAEEYIDKLEDTIEQLKASQGKIGSVHIGELLGVAAESIMRRNMDKLKKLPGGAALAGLLSDQPKENKTESETEASFEEVKEDNYWGDVEEMFSADELERVKLLLAMLAQHKDKINWLLETFSKELKPQ